MQKLKMEFLKFRAVIKSYPKYPILLLILLVVLTLSYWHRFHEDGAFADKFWELIDPVSAISTFFITLIVLYNQNRQRWENILEKQLDVDYVYVDESKKYLHIAQVRGAYLAGETDVRQWAQALGGQMMGTLYFDMNWDDPRPQIIRGHDGVFYKKYYVKMYLTDNPFKTDENNEAKDKAQKFINRKFQYSTVKGGIDKLPIIWERKDPDRDKMKLDFQNENLE